MTIIRLNTGKEHHHPPGEAGNIKSSTVIVGGDCLVCILHVCVGDKRGPLFTDSESFHQYLSVESGFLESISFTNFFFQAM